jgi:hypothetical protein
VKLILKREVLFISVAVILLIAVIVLVAFLPKTQDNQQNNLNNSIMGDWFAWHDNFEKEVLSFNDDGTYQSTMIYFEEARDKYRIEGDAIYLDGIALFQGLVMERQGEELVLVVMNDYGLAYFRSEEAAQADFARRTEAKDVMSLEDEPLEQIRQGEQITEEQIAKDLLGPWDSEFAELHFGNDGGIYFYHITDASGNSKTGEFRVTSPTTMILFDPETQTEELVEFSLEKEPIDRTGLEKKTFVSEYFEKARTFVQDPSIY